MLDASGASVDSSLALKTFETTAVAAGTALPYYYKLENLTALAGSFQLTVFYNRTVGEEHLAAAVVFTAARAVGADSGDTGTPNSSVVGTALDLGLLWGASADPVLEDAVYIRVGDSGTLVGDLNLTIAYGNVVAVSTADTAAPRLAAKAAKGPRKAPPTKGK